MKRDEWFQSRIKKQLRAYSLLGYDSQSVIDEVGTAESRADAIEAFCEEHDVEPWLAKLIQVALSRADFIRLLYDLAEDLHVEEQENSVYELEKWQDYYADLGV